MPAVRNPARAGAFYPETGDDCTRAIAELRRLEAAVPATVRGARLFGGIVPHAGWSYSGPTALAVFDALKDARPKPETVVIFATGHRPDVEKPSVQAEGEWLVPGGKAAIDSELARAMLQEAGAELLLDRALSHEGDHAVEVQLPFLLETLPGARFVPVAMPHGSFGPALGAATARAIAKTCRAAAVLASVDLTHYGPDFYGFAPKGVGREAHRWSKETNDRRFLDTVLALDAEAANELGEAEQSCCGPSAAAATVAAVKALGAKKGVLLEHITSWERGKEGEPGDFVGYAGVVFV